LVISDSSEKIRGVRVEPIFKKRAGFRNVPKMARMRRIVRGFAPDIVHGHYLTVGGFYAAFSGGRKIVGSAWGSDVYYGPEQSFKERMILKSALKRLDLVFAGTAHMAQRVRAYGYYGDIRIFRWGADPNLFRKLGHHGTEEFRVLSVRPCDRIYNPIVVLNAFKLILQELRNTYLYLFDFGNMIGMVHEIIEADRELAGRVRFLPQKPYGEMPEVYNTADIAISLPDSDSAAASVLEAMACELPVIATDIPNMREWIVDGVDGYLTLINPESVAAKLRVAHSARAELANMGRRARAKVLDEKRQGTFESNIRVAEDAYKKLLS